MYSVASLGVEYCTHSPGFVITACPAGTSSTPSLWRTSKRPLSTSVYSWNSGVCPGSFHPAGLRMCATLTRSSRLLTRPTYSSIVLGKFPAGLIRVGVEISVGKLDSPAGFVNVCSIVTLLVLFQRPSIFPRPGQPRSAAHIQELQGPRSMRAARRTGVSQPRRGLKCSSMKLIRRRK